ncbi:carbohydrate-binding domain-containing protein [Paracraurococcus ruber]|uniref:GH16 domain-containing protein n=1 Tax=Paracraurococcus ruber TaxID=77675 RepID=A0ABS1D646_9PROT|nr:carbohydrate-binding domain-containing protein [Paracraurococcus ruber]MBK1661562.1 hypothetical protein [Paracraurococcus ruber]TDG19183.1 glycosyl hydrolase family protein [Paracraurococcus ruber]
MDLGTANTTGPDSLVLSLSQEAWQGDAQFTVSLDGQQVGGIFSAASAHGQASDTLTLHGDFGAGQHQVTVTFLNDAYAGSPDTDRNLHVDGIALNGAALPGGTADLLSAGSASFAFGPQGQAGAPAQPAVQPAIEAQSFAPASPGGYREVWHESFDNGLGMFSHAWGPGVDASVPGQITIHSTADNQDSGAMVRPAGGESGFGFGLYSFTLKTAGPIGTYALTWPASDAWPGPEMDILEIDGGGRPYSTLHWKGGDGSNQYTSFGLGDVDVTQTHTYALDWQPGRLTMFVDGREAWTTTDHVPMDAAHGGENTCPGIGVQTWWNDGALGGGNFITLYDASYSVIG